MIHNGSINVNFHVVLIDFKLRGFYKGMLSPLSGAAFVNAILFGAYSQTKNQLQRRQQDPTKLLPLSSIMIAGGVAGIANSIACGPVELVKTQLQVQSNSTTTSGSSYK